MLLTGHDIASYQPDTAPAGDFCFIKSTEGVSYVNPRLAAQSASARKQGQVVGFYHFLRPGQISEQAAWFVKNTPWREGDFLVCDWESTKYGHPTNAEKDAFIREVQRLRPLAMVGLYCNTNDWLHLDKTSFRGDFLWIAQYNNKPGKPSIKSAWVFHQWTSTPLDTNVAIFNRRADLITFARRKIKGTVAPGPGVPNPPKPKPTVPLPPVVTPKPLLKGASDVIKVATSQVGYHEGKTGGHWNNATKYAPAVKGLEWAQGQPWCAVFVRWCFEQAGMGSLVPKTASVAVLRDWAKKNGRFSEFPAIGAVAIYGATGASHTGIVEEFDATTITVIEGNTSDNGSAEGDGVYVKRRVRRDPYVYGYLYPKYPAKIVSADPAWVGKR